MGTIKGFVGKNIKAIAVTAVTGTVIVAAVVAKNIKKETGLPEGYDGMDVETENEPEDLTA